MDPEAMLPFGSALLAFIEGDRGATFTLRRDDGIGAAIPASFFFREESAFSALERAALELCRGSVLDAGAGSGLHTLVLQERKHSVTAIDICPQAVTIMKRRGVRNVVCSDISGFHGGPFDTVLMMGHGIGMVENLAGLDGFLDQAKRLTSSKGQLLLDSLDVRLTEDEANLAYHRACREAGCYIGEIKMRFEFRELTGPYCGWLHVDPDILKEHAAAAGFRCDVVHSEKDGNYLARLSFEQSP